ncbi:aminotransferase class I/II-fold pyridoxal phosphate-dependent enzyme [Caminibacter mediatlanticus TB-2]|uniref:Aminotransferase n=1 Tax=Caminibacter mediatlanticus TB-2 TaxID=391592 RepID=A0ABX5VB66_9BACT|nr:aminotransferase class I/II-fold pyridoxal phosphate-dependent enzyme [Caminibacter mediatlanticus]QCT94657.1 aminotransferase class I/II-fold pyridoxal phosphate-dependent enzyme [Caminibacter mediatlanticus TB-2]
MKPFIVMDIVSKAKTIDDVIHLEIGEPDTLPSPKVKKASIKAIEENKFFYTESKGLKNLREKIAKHYKIFYDVEVNPNNIIITTGTSTAFLIAFYFAKKIATPTPNYPCYENFAELEHKEFVKIPTSFPDYQINIEKLKEIKFDTLMISFPNNPTGTVIDKENLKKICEFCKINNKLLISDELYHGLVYEKEYTTALKYNKNAIIINGFSKFFSMPGFRMGWIILPDNLVREAEIIAQNILISAPTISQYAAIEAFDYGHLQNIQKIFKKRRNFLYNELKDIFEIAKPDGAFYLWCNISKYSENALSFCDDLLIKAKVATTPGIDFGDYKKFIRIAYTKDITILNEAVKRIKKFIKNI